MAKKTNISEHPFDSRAKRFYTQHHLNMHLHAISEFEIYSRAKSIDIISECTEQDIKRLKQTCFSHYRRVNSLELKGPHDGLTTTDLSQIITRAWGLSGRDKAERKETNEDAPFLSKETIQEMADYPSRRTITIVSVTRPDKILNTPEIIQEYGFHPTLREGVYKSSKIAIPMWIIHPDELALIPRNYPLLPLSRGKKLQQFVELCVEKKMDY
ncbi:MAG: hypothetical protein AAF639_15000, partial [Chloroflexota bacterium]